MKSEEGASFSLSHLASPRYLSSNNSGLNISRAVFERMLFVLLKMYEPPKKLFKLMKKGSSNDIFSYIKSVESVPRRDGEDLVNPLRLLPLLRKAEELFRRSFDSRNSQTALGIQFWRREDAPSKLSLSSSSTGPLRRKSPAVFGVPSARSEDLAHLLGQHSEHQSSQPISTTKTLGRLRKESWQDGVGGVAIALNSPVRISSEPNSRRKSKTDLKDNNSNSNDLFSSMDFLRGSQVRNLILSSGSGDNEQVVGKVGGNTAHQQVVQPRIFRGRPHTLQKEFVADKTAVADALGSSREG